MISAVVRGTEQKLTISLCLLDNDTFLVSECLSRVSESFSEVSWSVSECLSRVSESVSECLSPVLWSSTWLLLSWTSLTTWLLFPSTWLPTWLLSTSTWLLSSPPRDFNRRLISFQTSFLARYFEPNTKYTRINHQYLSHYILSLTIILPIVPEAINLARFSFSSKRLTWLSPCSSRVT